ncbi:hypothetical protein B0T25DRAFT_551999 [Lasiosphaeria hispida]|uniref:Uncharacterized protein n=1 Tax=Lasiosphaeria hispida TaxID=260671 RepID=A0AAJ0HB98_9PEZI|nr:hypothetical protein B0T25DRAFT_551999 [Lasiosphaeria hispida]
MESVKEGSELRRQRNNKRVQRECQFQLLASQEVQPIILLRSAPSFRRGCCRSSHVLCTRYPGFSSGSDDHVKEDYRRWLPSAFGGSRFVFLAWISGDGSPYCSLSLGTVLGRAPPQSPSAKPRMLTLQFNSCLAATLALLPWVQPTGFLRPRGSRPLIPNGARLWGVSCLAGLSATGLRAFLGFLIRGAMYRCGDTTGITLPGRADQV